jgi:hypothetical protein
MLSEKYCYSRRNISRIFVTVQKYLRASYKCREVVKVFRFLLSLYSLINYLKECAEPQFLLQSILKR